ncbi:MAG TPA: adenylate/guanylate cyclase domain-containing protein [Candidatus Rifleibacterium sp.]|nr:adenylate/guanylate cyclase domain-containing protein [Candidatus Rifleibacterium sp.]
MLAERLESKAQPGQILISDSVWREVGHMIKFNELEPVMLKGKSKPQEVYEVIDLLKP